MVTQFIIPYILTFFSGFITPSPAEWTRKIILGYTAEDIVYMEFKRSAPGSYYQYVDSAFIVSRDPSNRNNIEKLLVRATWHEDSTSMGDWIQKELTTDTLDINQYMSDKVMHYCFSSSKPSIGKLKFEEYGILLDHNEVGILLLSKEKLAKQSPELLEILSYDKVRIVAKHNTSDHLLLTVQTGMDSSDSDFKQHILAIPMKELSEAEKTFRELSR